MRALVLAALLGTAAAAGCRSSPPRRDVIVTTDVGTEVDDQWAVGHLLLAERDGVLDLKAIVTTHAPNLRPPASHDSAREARAVVAVFQPAEPPLLIAGHSDPMGPGRDPRGGVGPAYIARASRSHSPADRLLIVSLGAATDIAEAILLDPGVADRIEVVAMAFQEWPGGGDSWNARNDPEAFRVLLESRVPLTIGPAATCVGPLNLDPESAAELTRGGGKRGELLLGRLKEWLTREMSLSYRTTGGFSWPLWDLITVAHVLGLTSAERRQRPRLGNDLEFDLSATTDTMTWITEVDAGALWADLRERLARAP